MEHRLLDNRYANFGQVASNTALRPCSFSVYRTSASFALSLRVALAHISLVTPVYTHMAHRSCGSPLLGMCLFNCCRIFGYPFLWLNVRLSRQQPIYRLSKLSADCQQNPCAWFFFSPFQS